MLILALLALHGLSFAARPEVDVEELGESQEEARKAALLKEEVKVIHAKMLRKGQFSEAANKVAQNIEKHLSDIGRLERRAHRRESSGMIQYAESLARLEQLRLKLGELLAKGEDIDIARIEERLGEKTVRTPTPAAVVDQASSIGPQTGSVRSPGALGASSQQAKEMASGATPSKDADHDDDDLTGQGLETNVSALPARASTDRHEASAEATGPSSGDIDTPDGGPAVDGDDRSPEAEPELTDDEVANGSHAAHPAESPDGVETQTPPARGDDTNDDEYHDNEQSSDNGKPSPSDEVTDETGGPSLGDLGVPVGEPAEDDLSADNGTLVREEPRGHAADRQSSPEADAHDLEDAPAAAPTDVEQSDHPARHDDSSHGAGNSPSPDEASAPASKDTDDDSAPAEASTEHTNPKPNGDDSSAEARPELTDDEVGNGSHAAHPAESRDVGHESAESQAFQQAKEQAEKEVRELAFGTFQQAKERTEKEVRELAFGATPSKDGDHDDDDQTSQGLETNVSAVPARASSNRHETSAEATGASSGDMGTPDGGPAVDGDDRGPEAEPELTDDEVGNGSHAAHPEESPDGAETQAPPARGQDANHDDEHGVNKAVLSPKAVKGRLPKARARDDGRTGDNSKPASTDSAQKPRGAKHHFSKHSMDWRVAMAEAEEEGGAHRRYVEYLSKSRHQTVV